MATITAALLSVVVFSGSCFSPAPDDDRAVVIFAASSLAAAFGEIEAAFELANPDLDVRLNFAGSASLREQILEGAPADVFASANESNIVQLDENHRLAHPAAVFAQNELVIAVPTGNPARIETLSDFGNDAYLLGLCDVHVPCGDYARRALTKAAIVPRIDTNESDARALLTKIEAGELDAGIVYRTDIMAASDLVDGVALPDHLNVVSDYRIAMLVGAPNPAGGQRFIDFVLSNDGQRIMARNGFISATAVDDPSS